MSRAALGRYRQAIDDFDQCLRYKPGYEEVLVERALTSAVRATIRARSLTSTPRSHSSPPTGAHFACASAVRERLGDDAGALSPATPRLSATTTAMRACISRAGR